MQQPMTNNNWLLNLSPQLQDIVVKRLAYTQRVAEAYHDRAKQLHPDLGDVSRGKGGGYGHIYK